MSKAHIISLIRFMVQQAKIQLHALRPRFPVDNDSWLAAAIEVSLKLLARMRVVQLLLVAECFLFFQ